jgi:tRNA (guanine-N7-)-methyltransferase
MTNDSSSFILHPSSFSLSDYHRKYLQNLCRQNRILFDSLYVWQFDPGEVPLNPRERFAGLRRTYLEIGFGHGEVLEELAARHPEVGFVGLERRPARVRKALKRLHRTGSNNVALIRVNLDLLEGPLFREGSFDEILVNHPDPWPKRRHEHHRFFRPATMDWLAHSLAPGGVIEVASDQADYFFHILHLFETDRRFASALPPPWYADQPLEDRPVSRFERKKRAAGIPVRRLRFTRK